MEKVFCKYHPSTPARWQCQPCRVDFCTSCARPDKDGEAPVCPLCGQRTTSLGAGNLIQPFWLRIPRFFLFPAYPVPLLLMLALTVLSTLLASGSLMGVLFMLAISVVFYKYAFVILEDTAQGYLKPRPITGSVITDELELPFKQLLLIIVLGVLNYQVLVNFGGGPFVLIALSSVAIFPAAIMVLAVEHSFFKAVNPLMLLVTIKRIGPSYFIMCFFLVLLLSGGAIASDLLLKVLPQSLWFASSNFISMYFILIMYNMMGYVIYQYHEQLGHDVTEEYLETETPSAKAAAGDPRFRHIDILLQEGKTAEAEQRLIQAIEENPGEFDAREKLHRFYIATKNRDGLMRHSADYVARLLHSNKPSEAMRVYLEASHIAPKIKPGGARERHELAQLLKSNGQSRAALSLLNNLHQEFPAYEGIPGAYLLVAGIMFEYFGEEQKALQVLDFLKKKFPGHPLQQEVEEYRRVIERMAGAGQPSA